MYAKRADDKSTHPVFSFARVTIGSRIRLSNQGLRAQWFADLRFNIAYEWRYSTKKVFVMSLHRFKSGFTLVVLLLLHRREAIISKSIRPVFIRGLFTWGSRFGSKTTNLLQVLKRSTIQYCVFEGRYSTNRSLTNQILCASPDRAHNIALIDQQSVRIRVIIDFVTYG
jgi:hypothetical protein